MLPTSRDIEPISKQLTIVIGLTVVGFMAFGLALSFYRNILFEETLQDLEVRNHDIAATIQQGYRDLEYFRSDQYKDKYAKENLGLIHADEKALIIQQTPELPAVADDTDLFDRERREAAYLELLRQMPIREHWTLYLFHKDKLEGLKGGL